MFEIKREKRLHPRVKTTLKLDIYKGISGDSIDLSEGGISFNSIESISSPTVLLQVHFPDRELKLKAKAKLVWGRGFEESSSLYGVEFIRLNKTQKKVLREELIKLEISGLLSGIKSVEIRNRVSHFFLKDVLEYINEILKLISHLPQRDSYSRELEKELDHLNNKILLKGYCLEELLSEENVMDKVKDNFRKLLGVWLYKSTILKQAFDKPKGYTGDYKVLEATYDNNPVSKNIGVYFDNIFLKSPYAVAVRLCKDTLRELLQKFISEAKESRIDILNIGCGSCREIRELLPNLKTKNYVSFICVDGNEEALKFSQDMLSQSSLKNVRFKFVKEDVVDIVENKPHAQLYGNHNLIYSMGLIDYLPDRVLKNLIQKLYGLLRGGGKLILTHKNKDKTIPPILPDWLCNWRFVLRSKDEVTGLFYASGISGFSLSVKPGNFGYVFYFILTKLARTERI